jgi:microcystin-dependent protein
MDARASAVVEWTSAVAEFAVAEPFLSEIRILGFAFAPKGWALCNGQLLPINQNTALFSLLGTTFGGDGRVSFALPDLQARTPVHVGDGLVLGQKGGSAAATLGEASLPSHAHELVASAEVASATDPAGQVLAKKPRFGADIYAAPSATPTVLSAGSLAPLGGGQPHLNLQPFLTVSFAIALQGIYPSRD